jgi:hypothetical protein
MSKRRKARRMKTEKDRQSTTLAHLAQTEDALECLVQMLLVTVAVACDVAANLFSRSTPHLPVCQRLPRPAYAFSSRSSASRSQSAPRLLIFIFC